MVRNHLVPCFRNILSFIQFYLILFWSPIVLYSVCVSKCEKQVFPSNTAPLSSLISFNIQIIEEEEKKRQQSNSNGKCQQPKQHQLEHKIAI